MKLHLLTKIHFVLLLSWVFTAPVFSQENIYESTDPSIGFNLVSYEVDSPNELADHLAAIDEMEMVNADHVNLIVFRRVMEDGVIDTKSGITLQTLAKTVRKAKRAGLEVTITPIFETGSESGWRGDWNPTGKTLGNFRRCYLQHLLRLAKIAHWTKADKLNIGSELVAFVNEPTNQRYLGRLLKNVGLRYGGELGYNANWDNYNSPAVETIFWNHPRISTLSVSMYPYKQLASFEESDNSHLAPEEFAEVVQMRWRGLVSDELLPYAQELKGGNGIPVAIGEFGAVPFNRCAATPASFEPSDEQDVEEQAAVVMGLIRSVDQLGAALPEVTVWQWGIGNLDDRFGLNPFHESPQQETALQLMDFMLDRVTREN